MSSPPRHSLIRPRSVSAPDLPERRRRTRRRSLAVAAVVATTVVAWLVFGLFEVQALFIDDVVSEPPPVVAADTEPELQPEPEAEQAPADTAPRSGVFSSRAHTTTGTAAVLTDGDGRRFLRLENFRTDNGPDVNVYLSVAPPDADGSRFDDDFVDLGDLKGNVGDQNYTIPSSVDLDRYSTVVIWCVRFSVVFAVAPLQT